MQPILHLYTAGGCILSFLENYTAERFQTTHCEYHDQAIKKIRQTNNSCTKKAQKVADNGLGHNP